MVRAFDAAGNLSDPSNTATATVPGRAEADARPATCRRPPRDRTRSTSPGMRPTDNIGVTGYRVFRNTHAIATLGAVTT